MLPHNKKLKPLARTLRKNMTDAEQVLWRHIRGKQIQDLQFYRQKTIGNYIVDFFCPAANLVIEVDGGQHYTPEGIARDRIRDDYLSSLGLKVLRFTDLDVSKNMEGVVETIYDYV